MRLCIDPGLRACGVAVGMLRLDGGGTIYRAQYVVNPDKKGRGPSAWKAMATEVWNFVPHRECLDLYVEVPRYYPRERYIKEDRNVDPNDLIELAGVVGAIVGMFEHLIVTFYYPSDWKGQVPKKIMTERIRKKLSPAELENMESVGAKDHNTLDAIGIFLHSCGRL